MHFNKWVVFDQIGLYLVAKGCIWSKWVLIGQVDCIWQKLLYSVKIVVFGQNGLYLAKWIVSGQIGWYLTKIVVFGKNACKMRKHCDRAFSFVEPTISNYSLKRWQIVPKYSPTCEA